MSTHDGIHGQSLYVTSEIEKFKNVRNMGDYLKTRSHGRKWRTGNTGRPNIITRLRSWSRSDRLALAILVIGVIALAVTVLGLLVAAGLLIL